ncbi:hypothetical protein TUN199_11183 [Pyrenophora tritici-repentis]|nr:hypothetical protein Alg130_11348 [Pyrenophora tritici-repentis]KAI0604560.1 hypothetical protein TUN205_11192 [Pyrenophora tritici-repentis]KAI0616824.1 hypothetical protein TUN199_11183 [Pyrenophora tritici-repentis]
MSQYNRSSTSSIDDTGNAMLLQASLYIAFNRPRFVFVPKPSGNDGGMRLVLHLLEPSAEFAHLYHNRELQQSDVDIEILFARFAWTLFPLLEAFLSCKKDRRLTVRTTSHDQILDGGYFTAAACERFSMSSTRTRSVSPKKRKPDEGAIDSNSVDDINVPQQWLEKERKRSDPEQTWTKDMLWVQKVWAGKTIASHEVPRFWNLSGYEVRDTGPDDLLAGVGPAK